MTRAAWLAVLVGCGPSTPMARTSVAPARTVADASASVASAADAGVASAPNTSAEPDPELAASGTIIPLPAEPWYRDKTDGRRDECEPSQPTVSPAHFPAPFARCDTHVESYASPPGGNELHFHYRFFSVALTTARRVQEPGVCCYMIWEFPSYH